MNPRIIYERGKPQTAFLVDADNVIFTKRLDSKRREWKCRRFRQAVQIGDLRAGEVAISIDGCHTFPRPAQLEGPPRECVWEEFPPQHRGILEHAAKVLLSLPLVESPLVAVPRNGIKIGKPAVAKGYNDWKFLTAWCWSKWEDERMIDSKAWPFESRWLAMKNQLGYPHTEGTFRKMCASMELFVTESRKKR